MKTLCLYYSRSGMTKETMVQLSQILNCDLFEYTDGKDRKGILGYIGACIDSMKKSFPEITIKGNPDLSSYDRVFVGMPVWVEGPSLIGRAFLKQYHQDLPEDVYYVVTHMAKADYLKKIKAMDSLLGRPSKGQISLRTKDNDYIKEITEYASVLRIKKQENPD